LRLFVLFAFFLATASVAFACGCDVTYYPPNLSEAFDRADKVFRAKVVVVDEISSRTNIKGVGWTGRTLLRAEVRVTSTYKGDTTDLVYVVTAPSSAACGVPMQTGDDYVFFASDLDEVSCSGSRSVRFAHEFRWSWKEYVAEIEALQ